MAGAGFNYLQFVLGIVTGIFLVPLIIQSLGQRTYGLWLACGELIAYLALADLGVFSVLPWIVAGADGRGDHRAIRRLLANGLLAGAFVGIVIVIGGGAVWLGAVNWLDLPQADRTALVGPVALLTLAAGVSYPLRVFNALLIGLQDVTFVGLLALAQTVMTIVLTVTLLLLGAGAYSLAAAAGVPVVLSGFLAAWRFRGMAPDVLREMPRPTIADIGALLRESVGGWLGGFGYRLLAASNGVVLVILGHPEWVPIYVCTAKVGQILQQMCWTLPDSALVGLAQLYGENRPARTRQVVGALLDLHLLLIGSAACGVLAVNSTFVRHWVGPELYGGDLLNTLLVAAVCVSTLIHAIVAPVAVAGHRLQIGVAIILNGVLCVGLALGLGSRVGLPGLAIALVASSLATSFVWGVILLRSTFRLGFAVLWTDHFLPWLVRVGPAMAFAAWVGPRLAVAPLWVVAAVAAAGGALYLWWIRNLVSRLPLPEQVRRPLARFGLATVFDSNDRIETVTATSLPDELGAAVHPRALTMVGAKADALPQPGGTNLGLLIERRDNFPSRSKTQTE
jgi:O-antigen/teichoic acid export membrane protein